MIRSSSEDSPKISFFMMPYSPLSETKEAAGTRDREGVALQHTSRPRMRRCFRAILNSGSGAGILPHPNRRTPDHPPYSEMVEIALRALAEENGSTESSISAYIQSRFTDLPWGHDRLLPYYLRKLVVSGELISPSPDRYQVGLHPPTLLSSVPPPLRRRGRPRLHPPNTNPNPSFNPLSSAPPRRRGRSRLYRRRGRLPKIFSEGMPPLHLGQESPPLRRRRGRPPLRRDHAIGGIDIKIESSERGALGDPEHNELGHGKSLQGEGNSFVAPEQFSPGKEPPFLAPETSEHGEGQTFRNAEGSGWYCAQGNNGDLSLISLFGDGKKNGGSKSDVLEDTKQFELGYGKSLPGEGNPFVATEQFSTGKEPPFLAPELSEDGEGQPSRNVEGGYCSKGNAGGQLGISAFDDDKKNGGSESSALEDPEQPEQGKGQSLRGEGQSFVAPEQSGCVQWQFSPREEPLLLTPELGKVLPSLTPKLSEHYQGQQPLRVPPFVAPEQTKVGQDESFPGEEPPLLPGKEPPFLDSEHSEHCERQSSQRKALPSVPSEQTELNQEQSLREERPPLLFAVQPEHGHGLSLAPEDFEDGHEQRSQGEGTALVAPMEGELVLIEEVKNAAVVSRKRRRQTKRRLWFHG